LQALTINGIEVLQTANGIGVETPITIQMHFENSMEFSLGTAYKLTPHLTGKFGLSYDGTPVQDEYREMRLPGSNLYNVGMGLRYAPNEHWAVDVGYEHAFAANADVNNSVVLTQVGNFQINQLMNGTFNNSADIVGVQTTYSF
jgi:long-chain fatty acid transport protein